jgi:hypothetical protein
MSKNSRKAAALMTAITISTCMLSIPVRAALPPDNGSISIQNIAILSKTSRMSPLSNNQYSCYGSTSVLDGYTAGIKLEVQVYDGIWRTVKTWSTTDIEYCDISEVYTGKSGNQYRLKATHYAYNSSGSLVETLYSYSN